MIGSVRRRRNWSQVTTTIVLVSLLFAFMLFALISETNYITNIEIMNIRYDTNTHKIVDMDNMIEEKTFDNDEGHNEVQNNKEEEGTISSKKINEISTVKNESKEEPLILADTSTKEESVTTNNDIQTDIDTTTTKTKTTTTTTTTIRLFLFLIGRVRDMHRILFRPT